MKEIWAWIQAALVAVGGFLGWFVGGFDGLLYALIALMCWTCGCHLWARGKLYRRARKRACGVGRE